MAVGSYGTTGTVWVYFMFPNLLLIYQAMAFMSAALDFGCNANVLWTQNLRRTPLMTEQWLDNECNFIFRWTIPLTMTLWCCILWCVHLYRCRMSQWDSVLEMLMHQSLKCISNIFSCTHVGHVGSAGAFNYIGQSLYPPQLQHWMLKYDL